MLLTRALTVAGVCATALLAGMPSGGAASELSYDGTADASAQRVLAVAPGAPLSDSVVDAGGTRAQARANSLGMSTARAAQPYPGDTVIQGPALVGGLAPVPAPIPDYPFYAESSFPSNQKASATQGPVVLEATSSAEASAATADLAAAAEGAPASRATASVTASSDKVVATASTSAQGLVAGPLVIDGLTSTATTTRTDKGLTRSATLRAVGASIAGTPVSIDDRGITVAGTTQTLDQATPLLAALKTAGLEVRYVARQDSKDGVTAPALFISTSQAVPDNPAAAVPSVTYTVVLGQASAEVAGQAYGDGGPVVPPPALQPEQPSGPSAPAPLTSSPDLSTGAEPVTALPGPQALEPPTAAAPLPTTAGTTSPQLATRASVEPVAWSTSFYLALAGAALLVVLVLTLVRYVGVRYP